MARLRSALPLLLLAVLFIAACDEGSEAAPSELAELAVRLDDARLGGGVPGVGPGTDAPSDGGAGAPSSPVGTIVTVGATGGDGVSLRSGCSAGARIDGGWRDGTEVEVVEVGAAECEGWTRAQAAGVVSWVSNQYLPGLGSGTAAPPVAGEEPGPPPGVASVERWVAALDEASSRLALIARTATGSSMPHEAEFLRVIEGALSVLQTDIVDSALAGSGSDCGSAAATLADAAGTLSATAARLGALFEGWPAVPYPADIDRLAGQYAALVTDGAPEAAGCLDAA
jgi:hypothetical protein